MNSTQIKQQTVRRQIARFAFAALLILSGICAVYAQRTERIADSWRPVHFDVDLTFDEQMSQLAAAHTKITVEVLAASLEKVVVVGASGYSGEELDRTSEHLNVLLPIAANRGNKFDVTVNYHGQPKDGLIFGKDRDGNPSATGDNWPDRVHYWIPALDHPSA